MTSHSHFWINPHLTPHHELTSTNSPFPSPFPPATHTSPKGNDVFLNFFRQNGKSNGANLLGKEKVGFPLQYRVLLVGISSPKIVPLPSLFLHQLSAPHSTHHRNFQAKKRKERNQRKEREEELEKKN